MVVKIFSSLTDVSLPNMDDNLTTEICSLNDESNYKIKLAHKTTYLVDVKFQIMIKLWKKKLEWIFYFSMNPFLCKKAWYPRLIWYGTNFWNMQYAKQECGNNVFEMYCFPLMIIFVAIMRYRFHISHFSYF